MVKSKAAQAAENSRRKVERAASPTSRGNGRVRIDTDSEIFNRLDSRFRIVEKLTDSVIAGHANGMILSGPPGVGKTYSVEKKLKVLADDSNVEPEVVKGYVRTTALFKTLWDNRFPGMVTVFDDADTIFQDLNSLNLLKAALDTYETRRLTYGSEAVLVSDKDGGLVDRTFDFEGQIIFITNYDFDELIAKKHKFTEHFKALMSRSHYVSLEMRSARDYLVRVRHVINTDEFMRNNKVSAELVGRITRYLESRYEDMRELSIRSAVKLASLARTSPNDWEELADLTMLVR